MIDGPVISDEGERDRTLREAADGVQIATSDLERGAAVQFALELATEEEVAEATGVSALEVQRLSTPPSAQ